MEKTKDPPSNIANAAIYLFDSNFIDKLMIEIPNAKDFSLDVIPKFINRIYTFHTDDILIDIGNIKNLKKAKSFFHLSLINFFIMGKKYETTLNHYNLKFKYLFL